MKTERLEFRATAAEVAGYDQARGDVPFAAWARKILGAESDRAMHQREAARAQERFEKG